MVPSIQAACGRCRLLVASRPHSNLEFCQVVNLKSGSCAPALQIRTEPKSCNFCMFCGFVARGTRISERRRLCDAKTQRTIPGAHPSSFNFSCRATDCLIPSSHRHHVFAICTPSSAGIRFPFADHTHKHVDLRRLRTDCVSGAHRAARSAARMDDPVPANSHERAAAGRYLTD